MAELNPFPSPLCYLTASLLFEGPGDERRVSLDDCHILYPPALWQLGVRGDLDQLQAHLLPQCSCQATKLALSFGQVHGDLPVLTSVFPSLPKALWDAPHHGMGEAAIWAHVCHDFNKDSLSIKLKKKSSSKYWCYAKMPIRLLSARRQASGNKKMCFFTVWSCKNRALNEANGMHQEVQEESEEHLHPPLSASSLISVLHRLLLHLQTPRSGGR